MRLSDISIIKKMELVQDSEINSLGLLNHLGKKQFSFFDSEIYLKDIQENISAIITNKSLANKIKPNLGLIVSENPKRDFFLIHNHLLEKTNFYGLDEKTQIDESSYIHPNAVIAENNVSIGKKCFIDANVCIHEGTIIQDNVIVRAGCIIGTEGFQFLRCDDGIMAVKHAGGVFIDKNVELQANCCISKGLFKSNTEVGENSKFDNMVHIAHNVIIGKNCLVAANAMFAGTSIIGNNVWIGPSASISSGIRINDGASVTIGSVVTKDVSENQKVTGNFAIDHVKFINFVKGIR